MTGAMTICVRFMVLSFFAALTGCQDSSGAPACPVGAEGCECTAGDGCDTGLMCLSNTCVDPNGGVSGGSASDTQDSAGETSDMNTGPTTESDSAGTSAGDTSMVDECEAADGERLAGGFCLKTCTADEKAAGNDLFEDCVPLGMLCVDAYGDDDYCRPASWSDECATDEECGAGALCVTETYFATGTSLSYCRIDCSADGFCGPLRGCVESCSGDNFSTLGFCHTAAGWPEGDSEPTICE